MSTEDPQKTPAAKATAEQIPLLEDVVFDKRLVKERQAKQAPAGRLSIKQPQPRPTDLFPEVMVLNSGPGQTDAQSQMEALKMADSLSRVYSAAVIRKLRDELTLLLDDLDAPTDPGGPSRR
jgi:hypothetical protein